MTRIVTVFGSSLPGPESAAYADARRLGRLLAESGFGVANGGYAGLMEASARGAREAGGHTIGVTCTVWPQAANPWIVEEVRANSFPERIMKLIHLGAAYVVLPGGTGTLAELALSWDNDEQSEPCRDCRRAKTSPRRGPLLAGGDSVPRAGSEPCFAGFDVAR